MADTSQALRILEQMQREVETESFNDMTIGNDHHYEVALSRINFLRVTISQLATKTTTSAGEKSNV